MTLGTMLQKRIRQATRAVLNSIHQISHSRPEKDEEPEVLAVSNCYPTRIVLYAAAFQGGWKVRFMKSLGEAHEASLFRRPKAMFYDRTAADPRWHQYCSSFAREGIPFVLLAHRNDDETFLDVLGSGGYPACGNPLTSETVVNAVILALEMASLTPVIQM